MPTIYTEHADGNYTVTGANFRSSVTSPAVREVSEEDYAAIVEKKQAEQFAADIAADKVRAATVKK